MIRFFLLVAYMSFSLEAQAIRVLTFNVRYPAKSDGANVWEQRKDLLVNTIRKHAPDLMGTQELFYEQGQYIVETAPEFAWFGRSRRGNHEDEHMGIFYRKDSFELLSSGDFWLSKTPEVAGSISWDMTLPRMVTWGEFRHRKTGRRFRFFNTHFAHREEDSGARIESARLIADRLRDSPAGSNVILTGDFNTDTGSEPYAILTSVLADARADAANTKGPTGTFHGFSGTPGKERIDWILYRGKLKPSSVETLTDNANGRYPSDHFPVLVEFH